MVGKLGRKPQEWRQGLDTEASLLEHKHEVESQLEATLKSLSCQRPPSVTHLLQQASTSYTCQVAPPVRDQVFKCLKLQRTFLILSTVPSADEPEHEAMLGVHLLVCLSS